MRSRRHYMWHRAMKTRRCKGGIGANVDRLGRVGRSPLRMASGFPYYNLVRLLFEHGANPSASFNWSETALHQTSFGGGRESSDYSLTMTWM